MHPKCSISVRYVCGLAIAASLTIGLAFSAQPAEAAVIQVDVHHVTANSEIQSGFVALTAAGGWSVTSNGITVSLVGRKTTTLVSHFEDFTRSAFTTFLATNPLEDLMRDGIITAGTSTADAWDGYYVDITGLTPNFEYEITGYGYQPRWSAAAGNTTFTAWHHGTPGEEAEDADLDSNSLIASITNNRDQPANTIHTFNATTDGSGAIRLVLLPDPVLTTVGSTTAYGVVAHLNGLVVVPEPGSLALLGVGGLMLLRRRTR